MFTKGNLSHIINWDRTYAQVRFHSGRTDSDRAHHDYLNASGLGGYHWHHGDGPHLHPHKTLGESLIKLLSYNGTVFTTIKSSAGNTTYVFESIIELEKNKKYFTLEITGNNDAFYLIHDGEKIFVDGFWGTELNPVYIQIEDSPWNGALGGLDYLVNAEYFWAMMMKYCGLEGPGKVNFYTKKYQFDSNEVYFKYYEADPNDISLEGTNKSKTAIGWRDEAIYATNASFFGQRYVTSDRDIAVIGTIHVYNKKPLTSYSIYNYEESYKGEQGRIDSAMGVMYLLNSSNTPKVRDDRTYKIPFTDNNFEIKLENIKWAIGGLSLFLDDSAINSNSDYMNKYNKIYPYSLQAVNAASSVARTIIGYNESSKKVIFGIIYTNDGTPEINKDTLLYKRNAVTNYQARSILQDLGCNIGLMLDGGGSSQISYNENSENKALGIEDSKSNHNHRNVPAIIRINSGVVINWHN